ncbi:50S ribosomal protein L27 [Gemmata sp. JC717]|uniref:50S ribosomal protein L27 n=1 Tax=Gemmata algarum TaxID=2975278 RepID=UPI0021BB5B63|nr:50S ribosomal protein L27 [Gemmata algarum]MDY3554774.1 50S ribosomal protein L27 [Gemmata algarum]
MAHKTVRARSGRDSRPKRRGLKASGGPAVRQSASTVTRGGTRFRPGRFVYPAASYNIHTDVDGTVYFDQGGRRINVCPSDSAAYAPVCKPSAGRREPAPVGVAWPRAARGANSAGARGAGTGTLSRRPSGTDTRRTEPLPPTAYQTRGEPHCREYPDGHRSPR